MNLSEGKGGLSFPRSKMFRTCLVLFVCGSLAAGWLYNSRQPAVGTVTSQPQTAVKAAETEKARHFKGSTAEFDYPAVYTSTQSNPPSGQTVEQYSFAASITTAESRRISLTIKKNSPLDPMEQDSAYTVRQNDNANYEVESVAVAGQTVPKISKRDGSEVAYFVPGKNYYAILVTSSTRVQGGFLADADMTVSTFKWLD